jgi:hypothetical protein
MLELPGAGFVPPIRQDLRASVWQQVSLKPTRLLKDDPAIHQLRWLEVEYMHYCLQNGGEELPPLALPADSEEGPDTDQSVTEDFGWLDHGVDEEIMAVDQFDAPLSPCPDQSAALAAGESDHVDASDENMAVDMNSQGAPEDARLPAMSRVTSSKHAAGMGTMDSLGYHLVARAGSNECQSAGHVPCCLMGATTTWLSCARHSYT